LSFCGIKPLFFVFDAKNGDATVVDEDTSTIS
jgi:hypothetical protein